MTEIKPTLEDMENPYVLQLLRAIAERDELIDTLLELIKDTPHEWLQAKIKELIGASKND